MIRERTQVEHLKPILGPRYALGLSHVLVCAVFGAMLVYLNWLGLWYTDLWGHVAYGQWILNHHALPFYEPFMPLAASVRVINYCWLSQVILASAERFGGAEGLSNLFAVTMLVRYMVMARSCYLQTRRLGLAMIGLIAGFFLSWVRNPILRPEIFAALAFQLFLWVLTAHDRGAWQLPAGDENETPRDTTMHWGWGIWVGVPVLFAFWVNLHASVLIGLVVLGAHFGGRVIEVCLERRKLDLAALLSDRSTRNWALLTVVAGLAIMVNPRGPYMLVDSIAISSNPNLKTVNEWLPMAPNGLGGRIFALSFAALIVIFRFSKRRVRPVEALLLAAFSVGTYSSGRVVLWYVPIYVYAVLPHVAEVANRWFPYRKPQPVLEGELPKGRSFRYTMVCMFVVFWAFAWAHLSDRLLGAEPRTPDSLYVRNTPRALADYLIAHPPKGQIWNSQALGDWLTWAWIKHYGPDKPVIKLFTNTHMHLIPTQVWADYQNIGVLRPGWQELLEKYQADTIVLSKMQHYVLARDIRHIPGWTIQYEDENGMIVTRDPVPPKSSETTKPGMKPE